MRCAKCGREVEPSAPYCKYCATGSTAAGESNSQRTVCCPQCGSYELDAVRKTYDPGCGCIGLLLFGWIGLLLGLLGAGDVELVCRNCGTRWNAGSSGGRSCLFNFLICILVPAFLIMMITLLL